MKHTTADPKQLLFHLHRQKAALYRHYTQQKKSLNNQNIYRENEYWWCWVSTASQASSLPAVSEPPATTATMCAKASTQNELEQKEKQQQSYS